LGTQLKAIVTILTTAGNVAEAQSIARMLVERELAACVQSLPITSTYRWNGAVQEEAEILLLIKTRQALYPAVEAAIRECHSYETPEIICLPVLAGSDPYMAWVGAMTGAAKG